jgi:hypothetical protein
MKELLVTNIIEIPPKFPGNITLDSANNGG